MLAALLGGSAILALLAAPKLACAQACHREPGLEPSAHHGTHDAAGHHLALGTSLIGAAVSDGDYQGVAVSALWHTGRFGATLGVPVYRLHHEGQTTFGPGDVMLHGHVRVLGDAGSGAGLTLGAGLPTGSAEDGLGMGHVMLMGGAYGALTLAPADLLATLIVAKALGDSTEGAHAHHGHTTGGTGPIVDPMNAFELAGTLRASLALTERWAVFAVGLLAVPLEQPGTTRADAGPGLRLALGPWTLSAEARIGILGDPFKLRASLDALYSFQL